MKYLVRNREVCRALVVALVLTAVFASSSFAVQGFGKNKVQVDALNWQVLNTPHFQIHYYDGAEELAVRASLIAERTYREFSDRLGRDLPWRVPLILYNSHNDFSQTNISDGMIGEGTGGFSEPLRNRVVLPYNGSHEDFVHVIRHELVHSFMFHMAFGERSNLAGASFFHVPLWFAEGIAEWFSSGWDPEADMFVRDATINDYLQPIDRVGGFMVYKQGQAAMRLLAERYGDEKLVEFWWRVGETRSVVRALHSVYGLNMDDFNQLYRKEMRKRYWPRYSDLEDVADVARPLTDHLKEGTFLNQMPAINPAGDKLVYFSDREGLVDLWLMSALDGRIIRKLGRSRRSNRFESFHSFRSGISFAPDGQQIALVAKSGNVETLHTIDINNGDVTRSIKLGLDVANSPTFSPDGRTIALTGTLYGRTDLYLVLLDGAAVGDYPCTLGDAQDLGDGNLLVRLTDDVGDEARPVWSPDGRSLLFLHNPLAEIEYQFEVYEDGTRRLQWAKPVGEAEDHQGRLAADRVVVQLDLDSGRRRQILSAADPVQQVLWTRDDHLILVDSKGGFANIAIAEFDSDSGQAGELKPVTNLLGGVSHLTYSQRADRLVFSSFQAGGYDLFAADNFFSQWTQRPLLGVAPEAVALDPPLLVEREGLPDPLLDPDKVGLVEPYSPRLRVDLSQALAGGSVYFNPDVGLGMVNVISFSDLLADHRLSMLLNFYGSFSNSDLSASYTYLKRRIDYGGGIFHYNNFYNSIFTGMGEMLSNQTQFKEQNTGIFGFASYPLDTFRRFDFELQYLNSTRTNYTYTGEDYILLPGERTIERLFQPSLSYTHDTALYGLHGPVAGSRWLVSVARSIAPSESNVDRFTTAFDFRKYWLPWVGNSFAVHLSVAVSDGDDPRGFVLGGPSTLRGYRYYDYETIDNLAGTKMALLSFEYRVPFVDYLIFGWPNRWGLTGIGATTYVDLGTAWNHKVRFFGDDQNGNWGMDELHGDFGVGLRANFMFLPMRLDWAWKTDLRRVEDVTFQFSIGPEF